MVKVANLKYMEIYNHYLSMIRSGVLQAGDKLPTEQEVAKQFRVSRITVIRALKLLQSENVVHSIQGSGTYVRKKTDQSTDMKVASITMPISGQGRESLLIQGMESKFKEAGYMLTINNSHENPEIEKNIIKDMKSKVQGMILYPVSSLENSQQFEYLMREQWPLVYIDRYPINIPCSYVSCDNYDGGYQLGKFFLEAGHRQIALIYHDILGLSSERDRFDGFMQAMSEGNIPRGNIKIISINRSETSDTVNRILNELYGDERSSDSHPTAVFTFNDHLAILMMNCISEQKQIHLPPSFIIAGFDDLAGSAQRVPFVTIRQDYQAIGQVAAELLLEKIESQSMVNKQIVVPVKLIHYPVRKN